MALTDANGKLAAYYEYDAWGNTMTEAEKTGVDNPYRYSTKEWDEKSGLYYFGARYYSPEIGRWTQRDPLGVVDGLNLYGYVLNEPAGQVDAWGLLNGGYGGDPVPKDYGKKERETCLKAIRLAKLATQFCKAEIRAFLEDEGLICKGDPVPPLRASCYGLPAGHLTVSGPRATRVSLIDMWKAYDEGVYATAVLVGHEYIHQVGGGFMFPPGKPLIGRALEEQAEGSEKVFVACFEKIERTVGSRTWQNMTSRP